MKYSGVEVVCDARAVLGEGPVWYKDRLLWVDIGGRLVHKLDPSTGDQESTTVDRTVSAVTPDLLGSLVVATDNGFARLKGAKLDLLAEIEGDGTATRTNDAKVDAAGRFIAGTIALDLAEGKGNLYTLEADHSVRTLLPGLTVPNGLGWSPEGNSFYFIDSFEYRIDRYPYDSADGTLGERECLVDIPEALGLADGMTVDASGCVWVALFGGSAVHRYTDSGSLDLVVNLPVTHPTSCAFGGPGLSTLFVTSARSDVSGPMTEESLAKQPHAGAVFAFETEVQGLPIVPYAG